MGSNRQHRGPDAGHPYTGGMADPQPPELAEVYDAPTLAAIESGGVRTAEPGAGRVARRLGGSARRHPVGAAGVAGSLWLGGLAGPGGNPGFPGATPPEVADPVPAAGGGVAAVQVDFVWGSPRATVVVVRPWLLAGSR